MRRTDSLIWGPDWKRYAVVVVHPEAWYRMLLTMDQLRPSFPASGMVMPLFGLPVKIDTDEPEDGGPRLQIRVTPDQLQELIHSARVPETWTAPAPPPEPTIRAVVRKWWSRVR